MKILITSATFYEIKDFITYLTKREYADGSFFSAKFYNLDIDILITGVGPVLTTYKLTKQILGKHYDFALNLGICGSFPDSRISLGQTVNITVEQFGDLGINDNGNFITMFEANFIDPDEYPFTAGTLVNPFNFPDIGNIVDHNNVHSITVCSASGEISQIYKRTDKYRAQVENMEGAAFFYVMLQNNIPFLEIRAVSNIVEPRNKEKWEILHAIQKLNESAQGILMELASNNFKI